MGEGEGGGARVGVRKKRVLLRLARVELPPRRTAAFPLAIAFFTSAQYAVPSGDPSQSAALA